MLALYPDLQKYCSLQYFKTQSTATSTRPSFFSRKSGYTRLLPTLVPECPDSRNQCTRSCRGSGLSISTSFPLRLKRSFLVSGYFTGPRLTVWETVCDGASILTSITCQHCFCLVSHSRLKTGFGSGFILQPIKSLGPRRLARWRTLAMGGVILASFPKITGLPQI